MTIYINLEKSTPESIVSLLMAQCEQAAKSGIIHEEPVYVEFKKKVWTVTYVNQFGEFAQLFNSKDAATVFANNLLDNNLSSDVKIRGAEK